jgi:hypothetical protein
MKKNSILKDRLKYVIEANRISRMSDVAQDEIIKELKESISKAKGNHLERLNMLLGIIMEKREIAENARNNRTYAEYGGSAENGGGGSGNDSG